MNAFTHGDTVERHPEAAAFVAEVRRGLADLDQETRDDLVGGLEADLVDQLADGAPLGDPAAYAAELRAAAGLPAPRRRRRRGIDTSSWPRTPTEALDRSRAWFLGLTEKPKVQPVWEILVALRPAWWVARAWMAVTLLDAQLGGHEQVTVVPTLVVPGLGPVLLMAAIAVSTLIGLGRLWPGSGPNRSERRRLVLLGGNALAILTPVLIGMPMPGHLVRSWEAPGSQPYGEYAAGFHDGTHQGLFVEGHRVDNIFAYDANGQPIEQVQLVDQAGRPISIRPRLTETYIGDQRWVSCPARNGGAAVTNSFPFARINVSRGWCSEERALGATMPSYPLATLPPITLPWTTPADPPATLPTPTPEDR